MAFRRFKKRFQRRRGGFRRGGGGNLRRSIVNVARKNKSRNFFVTGALLLIGFILYKVGIISEFKTKVIDEKF